MNAISKYFGTIQVYALLRNEEVNRKNNLQNSAKDNEFQEFPESLTELERMFTWTPDKHSL